MNICPACEEPFADCQCFEECEVCHEKAYSYPRCNECGSEDIGWLHSRLTERCSWEIDEPLSELKRTGTGGWL